MKREIKIQKRLFLFFFAIAASMASLFAQDVITLKDGKEITVLVYEIDDINVKYKKIDNPNGPNYVLKKSEIRVIIYANGSKEEFVDIATSTTSATNQAVKTASNGIKPQQPQAPVETPPEFQGGELALQQWLKENLKYPEDAKKNEVQGKVGIKFTVWRDGSIKYIEVTRKIYPSLDKEAVRLVKSMPKWKPATKKGRAVSVTYDLPISFKLD